RHARALRHRRTAATEHPPERPQQQRRLDVGSRHREPYHGPDDAGQTAIACMSSSEDNSARTPRGGKSAVQRRSGACLFHPPHAGYANSLAFLDLWRGRWMGCRAWSALSRDNRGKLKKAETANRRKAMRKLPELARLRALLRRGP